MSNPTPRDLDLDAELEPHSYGEARYASVLKTAIRLRDSYTEKEILAVIAAALLQEAYRDSG